MGTHILPRRPPMEWSWLWTSQHLLLFQQPSMVLEAAAIQHNWWYRDENVLRSVVSTRFCQYHWRRHPTWSDRIIHPLSTFTLHKWYTAWLYMYMYFFKHCSLCAQNHYHEHEINSACAWLCRHTVSELSAWTASLWKQLLWSRLLLYHFCDIYHTSLFIMCSCCWLYFR